MCCQTHPADEFCFVQLWCIHHGSFGPIRPALFTGNSQSFTAEYNWNSALSTKLARLHSLDVFLLILHCCLAIALIALVFKAEPGHGACVCQSFHKSAPGASGQRLYCFEAVCLHLGKLPFNPDILILNDCVLGCRCCICLAQRCS